MEANKKANVREAASDLLGEGKKWAREIRQDGVEKMNEVEDSLKEYSDILLKKVQENPLSSVLIAGGIGFLLSKIMRK